MNKVEAIIRPEKLNDVKEALVAVGLVGLNVVNVTGRGAQRGVTTGGSRGVGRYEIDMLPKVKLELVVHDDATQQAIDTIVENARTGNIGDGKIFIYPVTDAIKVRTGERGDEAL
jgi:nitrogen regulatory protein P-II 1|tara:strand:+ start:1040 stop:1384 length:345 start_codon:yes stop_codon:yes gene_type:complete